MVRAVAVAALLLTMSLAGCIFGGNDTADDPEPEVPTGPSDPQVEFSADTLEGTKPLDVEFSLTFTEVRNRTLEWSIDVESDGTIDANGSVDEDDTVTYAHTFSAVGSYEATAKVTLDGTALFLENITIQVDTDQTTQRMTVTREFEFEGCDGPESYLDDGEVPFVGDETDIDPDDDDSEKIDSRIDFKATKATWKQVYQAEWSFNGSFLETWIFFTNSDGEIQDHETDAGPAAGGNITLHGRIPDASVWVVLYACGGSGEFTVDYITPRPGTE